MAGQFKFAVFRVVDSGFSKYFAVLRGIVRDDTVSEAHRFDERRVSAPYFGRLDIYCGAKL